MEDFKKLFRDEARDLLTKLEEALMLLENDLSNKELVNEVFRVMHSLKGSGAMFGYNNLSDFTHNLEALYDQIRNNILSLDSGIVDFTINTTDLISGLLENDDQPELLKLVEEKKQWIAGHLHKGAHENTGTEENVPQPIPENSTPKSLYYIKFEPDEGIFNDGTNPLYLIDELVDLGEAMVQMCYRKVPVINDLDAEKCYLYWIVLLATEADFSEINDVFIFVEDDCSLVIEQLSEKNLLAGPDVRDLLKNQLARDAHNLDAFRDICKEDEPEVAASKSLKEVSKKAEDTNVQLQNEILPGIESNKPTEVMETVKVSSKKLDALINLVSELVTTQARLVTISNHIESNELSNLAEDFQHLSRQFRDTAFDMRLVPLSNMLVKYKRLVRDLSLSLQKKVVLTTEGTETELDKSIISAISDPIMHIIRNAMDHGIEPPDIRLKNNKPETGTIHLKAEYSGTSILIDISDDGAGIDKKRVLEKAIEKKLITRVNDLNESEIFQLLLIPGFSTSKVVTDVSGRGVGMDIVRKQIEELRGEVRISSEYGKGTTVQIKLPLTLSIIDGLLVKVGSDQLIIPLSVVNRIHQVSAKKVTNARNNVVELEGTQLPFINLPLEFNGVNNANDPLHVITVSYSNKLVGLVVNELISEYQAVLKPIDKLLEINELFAGATILGDGKVALVLDTNKLIDYYTK